MRRHRRLVLIDRVIPFLAALVGLVALAGAVVVQMNATALNQRVVEQLAEVRESLQTLSERADALAAAADDGTAEGLLALQERMDRLEAEWATLAGQLAARAPVADPGTVAVDNPAREIDPDWPTENCIPTGTRFVATPGEGIPICESPVVITVTAISGDTVVLEGAGTVTVNGSAAVPGSSCTVSLLSADTAGFAEMRVTCT